MKHALRLSLVIVAAVLILGCPSPSGPDGPGDEDEDTTWTPGDVEQLLSVAGDRRVALYWWEPGGSFDHYVVSWTPGGETGEVSSGFNPEYVVTSLTNGVEYTFTVTVVVDENGISEGVTTSCTPRAQFLYGGTGDDEASAVTAIAGSEYVIAGTTASDELQDELNRSGNDVYLVRIDDTGAVAGWTTYGSIGDESANDIVATSDNGYAIAGEWEVIVGEYDDYLALVLDSGASRVFERAPGGSGVDNGFACLETVDGGFVFAGESFSSDISGLTYNLNGDAYVVKLDASGATVWQNMVGGTGWDRTRDIAEAADGTLMLAGSSYSTNLPGSTQDQIDDFYLVKLDTDGSLLWQKMFGGTWQDALSAIVGTSDGGFVVAGRSSSDDLAGLLRDDGQGYLAKVDTDGDVVWHTRFGGDGSWPAAVIQTSTGGYLVAGRTQEANLGYQGQIVEFDSGGAVIRECLAGGTGDERFSGIAEMPGGAYLVAGSSDSTDIPGLSSNGGTDFYAVIVH
jgi:fibronectin type III domain protein